MLKTAFMTAAAALVATAIAMPAHAGTINGIGLNGWDNGIGLNGWDNGIGLNGWENGGSKQGTATAATRFVIDGIELPARPF